MLDGSQDIWRMTVRVLREEDARCESGIWKMTVRELNGGWQVGDRGWKMKDDNHLSAVQVEDESYSAEDRQDGWE
jgi:hypothetical protein